MSIKMACCGNCLHWSAHKEGEEGVGDCRYNPPRAEDRFPYSWDTEWCRCFRPLEDGMIACSTDEQENVSWVRPDCMPSNPVTPPESLKGRIVRKPGNPPLDWRRKWGTKEEKPCE